MCIGIFSFRAFDRRLARLATPISSGVRQGAEYAPPPPSGARSAEYPSGARVNTLTGGGGGKKCPPLRFFVDSGKTATRSNAIFLVPAHN